MVGMFMHLLCCFRAGNIIESIYYSTAVHQPIPASCAITPTKISFSLGHTGTNKFNNRFTAPALEKYVGINRKWEKLDLTYVRQVAQTQSVDFKNWEKTKIVMEGLNTKQTSYSMPVYNQACVYIGIVATHDQKTDRVWAELFSAGVLTRWGGIE